MIGPALNGIIPVLCVTLAGLACMLAEAFRQKGERMPIGGLGAIGLVGAAAAVVLLWGRRAESFGVVRADDFGLFVQFVLVGIGLLTLVFSPKAIDRDNLPAGEYYALTLFAIAGMMLIAVATDLLVIFLALEVFSLALYVLTGLRRREVSSTEGAFKYFVLGGFASAFFLYGIAFTYGLAGSTHLDKVAAAVQAQALSGSPLLLVAMGLLLVGLAFKVAAVPFHMWTPDAYEAAPTVVTGFMSTAVKAAGFAVFARVFLLALEPLRAEWTPVLWVLAVCTMILGSVVGVAQTNLKRMLAYSSIAHGGYLLVALAAGDELGGLWQTSPVMAGLLTVFLLSLGGFPPTAGFVAKWYVFSAAVSAGQFGLAIIGVLTSVVSVFFYLRIVVMMYMTDKGEAPAVPAVPRPALAALSLSAIALFYLGVLPTRLLDLAARSVAGMF
jgi:NADH-quinone oxidoreductase subunit N